MSKKDLSDLRVDATGFGPPDLKIPRMTKVVLKIVT